MGTSFQKPEMSDQLLDEVFRDPCLPRAGLEMQVFRSRWRLHEGGDTR